MACATETTARGLQRKEEHKYDCLDYICIPVHMIKKCGPDPDTGRKAKKVGAKKKSVGQTGRIVSFGRQV